VAVLDWMAAARRRLPKARLLARRQALRTGEHRFVVLDASDDDDPLRICRADELDRFYLGCPVLYTTEDDLDLE